jgi:hypothetical protein
MASNIAQYIILNNQQYFAVADEFVVLEQLFKKETTFEKLTFWIDMVIYPLMNIVSIVFFNDNIGMFAVLSIHNTVTKWQKYLRYLQLKHDTDKWIAIVRSIGGPFISTNDEKYRMYIYADGMQRMYDSLFSLLSKKCTKRL